MSVNCSWGKNSPRVGTSDQNGGSTGHHGLRQSLRAKCPLRHTQPFGTQLRSRVVSGANQTQPFCVQADTGHSSDHRCPSPSTPPTSAPCSDPCITTRVTRPPRPLPGLSSWEWVLCSCEEPPVLGCQGRGTHGASTLAPPYAPIFITSPPTLQLYNLYVPQVISTQNSSPCP